MNRLNTLSRPAIQKGRNIYLLWILAALIFMASLFLLLPQKGMSPVWSVPYFSGAKEWTFSGGWLFQPLEVDAYKQLKGWEIYLYSFDRFSRETLIQYGLNSSGYLYLVILSQMLFPFLGPVGSIVLLQILTHGVIVVIVYRLLPSSFAKQLFLIGYGANPVILYFVVYPFYYFWQVIPSFVFLVYYFSRRSKERQGLFLNICLALLLFAGLVVRNTTILVVAATICLLFRYSMKQALWVHVSVLLLGGLIWIKYFEHVQGYGPWHNAFIGFAGYPNQIEGLEIMNDDTGYAWYIKYSGKQIDASIEGNFTTDLTATKHYYAYMKDSFLDLVKRHPIQFFRNLSLNFLQGFSVGYIGKAGFAGHLFSALIGAFVLGFLIMRRAWIPIGIIALSHITYSVYYPPIPAYMYGSYLLIICLLLDEYVGMRVRKKLLI